MKFSKNKWDVSPIKYSVETDLVGVFLSGIEEYEPQFVYKDRVEEILSAVIASLSDEQKIKVVESLGYELIKEEQSE